MTSYYLTCGGMFILALAHLSNTPRANPVANAWLGGFFLCAGSAVLAFIAQHTGLDIHYPFLVPLSESIRLLMAPTLYLAVLYFTAARRNWKPTDYLHFLPAVLFLPLLFLGGPHLPRFLGMFVGISVKLQLLIYWLLSFHLLRRHSSSIREVSAEVQKIDLKWLQYMLLGIAVLMLLWYNQVFRMSADLERFTGIGYLLAVYVIAFFSLRQREIFPYAVAEKAAIQEVIEKKSLNPRLTDDDIHHFKARLDQLMTQEQLFTDSDLNLPQLAGKMNISVHELSYLLNKGYGQNFYQYINQYRVARVKELMASEKHQHLSMLGIAFEAGFNSKTTFNTTFKKIMGMSPGEYRELLVRMDTTGQ
ncbi:helix-turn-helix domain-containing protein [Chitinophaga filiformis]|uniref:AraC-type DNA-binding protein n=1 Tax=Chitinophaga filiformis TaxID=104663 RepID=A0A1G7NQH1_CHIFI|nr:helix-turn-helix transcriptional regulator [Chitinophaga filiformis]SDF76325.1 AraC-type DNA-binding protein [Chitinophaga filiformis]